MHLLDPTAAAPPRTSASCSFPTVRWSSCAGDDPEVRRCDLAAVRLARHRHRASRQGLSRSFGLLGHRPLEPARNCCSSGVSRRRGRASSTGSSGSVDRLDGYDLIVTTDGVDSLVRRPSSGTSWSLSRCNHFAWYSSTASFAPAQTFRATPLGPFDAHHYPYTPTMSTFVVECDAHLVARRPRPSGPDETWRSTRSVFADTLPGLPLISNRSIWRPPGHQQLLVASGRRAAQRCPAPRHLSIGSGTHLAWTTPSPSTRPSSGLVICPQRFGALRCGRRPSSEQLVHASKTSGRWYERFPEHMKLPSPGYGVQLHHSLRADRRSTPARNVAALYGPLRERAAEGRRIGGDMNVVTATEGSNAAVTIVDNVPLRTSARLPKSIGFSVPDRYNASDHPVRQS